MTFIIRKKQVRVNVLSVSIRKQSGRAFRLCRPAVISLILDLEFLIQNADCIQNTDHRHTGIRKHSHPHIGQTKQTKYHDQCFDHQSKCNILFCNSSRCSCNLQRLRDCFHRRGHKYHVCSFNRCIRSASHRSSHICAARTGASLIPSPTNITLPCFCRIFCNSVTLS